MHVLQRGWTPLAALGVALAISATRGDAHKPITSPFTFVEDVAPILRAQCGSCHLQGGVAPMPLVTHADTVPWGESIRVELLAGHMPPWAVDGPAGRFQNAQGLTARELDVLLTWVSGGTPAGDLSKAPAAARADPDWRLGPPDLLLPVPAHTLRADEQDETAEFTIPVGNREPLWVRAADVRAGTPAIVRSATVRVRQAGDRPVGTLDHENVLAVWAPGDHPVALSDEAAFVVPPGADLVVSIHYRKTWEYERQVLTDRSVIGLYLAPVPAPAVQALVLAPDASAQAASGTFSYTRTIERDLRVLAIYPDAALAGAHVTVTAARPDGSRDELIAFRPAAGWARRYWFTEPVPLPRGSVVTVTSRPDTALLPPGALPQAPVSLSSIRLTLNAVPARP